MYISETEQLEKKIQIASIRLTINLLETKILIIVRKFKYSQFLYFVFLVIPLLILISGCKSALKGSPNTFLSKDNKNKLLTKYSDVDNLIKAANEDERNEIINNFLAEIDLHYAPFRLALTKNDNHVNAFTDALVLLSSLAGTLTNSAGVKNNYLTLTALATGAHSIYDNRYLYTQSIFALIKGMDAARAQQLVEIRDKMSSSINYYSGHSAFTDIMKYSYAGTLPGSLNWIQSNATKVETKNIKKLGKLRVPGPQVFDDRREFRHKFVTAFLKLNDSEVQHILSKLPDGIEWDNTNPPKDELMNVYRLLMSVDDYPTGTIEMTFKKADMQF